MKDVERRLKKFRSQKSSNKRYLKTISDTKEICLDILDRAINKLEKIEYSKLEGYELRISNDKRIEVKRAVSEDEDYYEDYDDIRKYENFQCDIILKNDSEEIIIGDLNCDVKISPVYYESDLNRCFVEVNRINISEEYRKMKYGSYILKHIPIIISNIYKCEIYNITTTIEFLPFDRYKIGSITYSERVEALETWLKESYFKETENYKKDSENKKIKVFEMDLNKRMKFDYVLEKLLKDMKTLCFTVWSTENKKHIEEYQERCKVILKEVYDDKYITEPKESKIKKMKNMKENFIKIFEEQTEIRLSDIELLEKVVEKYKKIPPEELEINKKDTLDDTTIKLYCMFLNLGRVATELAELGFKTKSKTGKNKTEKYTTNKIKEIICDSITCNKELQEYAKDIIIANRISADA